MAASGGGDDVHELVLGHDDLVSKFLIHIASVAGASFIVNGATPAKDLALAPAGAELRLAHGVTLGGKFDGEFAKGSFTYGGTGTLRVNW
jgi:uncharacterized protein with beta-barrel porin domain